MKKSKRCHCLFALAGLVLFLCTGVTQALAAFPVDRITVVDTVATGPTLNYMALSPDGGTLYAVQMIVEPDDVFGDVVVIDTATNTITATIPLGAGIPLQIDVTSDGDMAFVAISERAGGVPPTSGQNRVVFIDTQTNTVTNAVLTGGSPFGTVGLAITPDDAKVYATHRGSSKVDVIDVATATLLTSIPVGSSPVGVEITPDGTRAYVASRIAQTVSVIDTSSDTVDATIPVTIGPSTNTTSVAFTPDGSRAYVSFFDDNEVAVIDTDPSSPTFNQQTTTVVTSGSGLREIDVTADGTQAFVVSDSTNEVLVLDVDPTSPTFHTQIGAVPVGPSPFDISIQELPVAVAYVSVEDAVRVLGLETLIVDIDIKPDSDPNCFNQNEHGVLPVAIFGSADFDVRDVDVTTLSLQGLAVKMAGRSGKHLAHLEEVNGDGFKDLVLQFEDDDTWMDPDDGFATLTGALQDGTPIQGMDTICLVP